MSMSMYPPPGGRSVGRRFEEALEAIELELQHAIAYVNDAVVPEIRRESITAMRAMSDTLRNLADKFERSGAGIGGSAAQSPGKAEDTRR
jgi:hypothetical protein